MTAYRIKFTFFGKPWEAQIQAQSGHEEVKDRLFNYIKSNVVITSLSRFNPEEDEELPGLENISEVLPK